MKKIKIKFLNCSINIDLYDTQTSNLIWESCPIESVISTWGDEVYFDTKIQTIKEENAKDVINKGEIAFWVEGSSIAIGFGPTPISHDSEIRLITKANIIGETNSDLSLLSMVNSGEIVIVEQI